MAAQSAEDVKSQGQTQQLENIDTFASPGAVTNQLNNDHTPKDTSISHHYLETWQTWKKEVTEDTGLNFSTDYIFITYRASESLGDNNATSGVLRFYGKWDLTGSDTTNTGSLIYKFESRDAYSDVAPQRVGAELGYIGTIVTGFSNQHFRTTNFYWRQNFNQSNAVSFVGFLDVTDYTDVYLFASPWTAFTNSVFLTGSGTMGVLPDGALGGVVATWLSDSLYAVAGIADANGNSTDVFQSIDTFFNDFETFKNIDLHWTPQNDQIYLNNLHVSLWQIDERTELEINEGWGVSFSLNADIADKYIPFIRGGWAEDSGSDLEASLSIGLGFQQTQDNLLGLAINWGRPNKNTFGTELVDQYTSEIFYRWQVAKALQLTPSVQLISNPARNPDEDFIYLVGLRVRFLL